MFRCDCDIKLFSFVAPSSNCNDNHLSCVFLIEIVKQVKRKSRNRVSHIPNDIFSVKRINNLLFSKIRKYRHWPLF